MQRFAAHGHITYVCDYCGMPRRMYCTAGVVKASDAFSVACQDIPATVRCKNCGRPARRTSEYMPHENGRYLPVISGMSMFLYDTATHAIPGFMFSNIFIAD